MTYEYRDRQWSGSDMTIPRRPAWRGPRLPYACLMTTRHTFDCTVTWTGNRGTGTSGYRDFDRSHEISGPDRPPIAGSAAPAFRGDAGRWNPEQMLLASLSQCHLMTYLYLAVGEGIVVTAYADRAACVLLLENGRGRVTEAVLRPTITLAADEMVPAATALHERASAECFVARSVNFPIRHEPTILVGAGPH